MFSNQESNVFAAMMLQKKHSPKIPETIAPEAATTRWSHLHGPFSETPVTFSTGHDRDGTKKLAKPVCVPRTGEGISAGE